MIKTTLASLKRMFLDPPEQPAMQRYHTRNIVTGKWVQHFSSKMSPEEVSQSSFGIGQRSYTDAEYKALPWHEWDHDAMADQDRPPGVERVSVIASRKRYDALNAVMEEAHAEWLIRLDRATEAGYVGNKDSPEARQMFDQLYSRALREFYEKEDEQRRRSAP